MALNIQSLVIDAHDPSALASFWEQALGWRRRHEVPDEVVLEPPSTQCRTVSPRMSVA